MSSEVHSVFKEPMLAACCFFCRLFAVSAGRLAAIYPVSCVFCPVMLCSGFLRAQQQVYLIEPLGQTDDEEHAVYRQEHLKISGRPACGSSSTTMLYDQDQDPDRDRNWVPKPAGLFRSRSWVCCSMNVF